MVPVQHDGCAGGLHKALTYWEAFEVQW